MIYFEQAGRLGNQLFRYAAARAAQLRRGGNEDIVMGVGSYRKYGGKNGFVDSLRDLCIGDVKRIEEPIAEHYPCGIKLAYRALFQIPKIQRLSPDSFENRYWHIFNKLGILLGTYGSYKFDICHKRNLFLDGNFQDPAFFNDIREVLLREFCPKYPEVKDNTDLYHVIRETESVCISIRRGDFLSTSFKGDFFVCGKDYFLEAMNKIKEYVKDPTFIFFSDDIEWVRNNIKVDCPCYYESGKDPVWEKVRLMYSCKHFILSNSSFSWWVQYLSRNKDKVVIAPDHWYNNRDMEKRSNLLEPDFIKIPCPRYD